MAINKNPTKHTIKPLPVNGGKKVAINDNNNANEEWGLPTRAYGGTWDLGVGKNPMAPRLPKKGK